MSVFSVLEESFHSEDSVKTNVRLRENAGNCEAVKIIVLNFRFRFVFLIVYFYLLDYSGRNLLFRTFGANFFWKTFEVSSLMKRHLK